MAKSAKSAKSSLALTREQFRTGAKTITVVINGKEYTAAPKEFSTGSLGWNINDKVQVEVAGQMVTVQVGMNLTIVGSKDLPQDRPLPGAEPVEEPSAAPAPPPAAGENDRGESNF